MAKIDIGDKLQKAGNIAQKATGKAVAIMQTEAKALKDATKNEAERISENVKTATEQRKTKAAQKKIDKKAAEEKASIEATGVIAISPKAAMKIFYCMMAVDGEIKPEEEEKLKLIGKEMDCDSALYKDIIETECKAHLDKISDIRNYYDVVLEIVANALNEEQISNNGFITPKLLIWDLLTLAYGDEEYGYEEQKLLKYLVDKLDIPKDIFLEMESSLQAISDIEREIVWLKSTDRPYITIEKQIHELEKRRNDIIFSVKALIAL